MARILPSNAPSLDRALWDRIRLQQREVNKKMGVQLASKDRGFSHQSDLWTKDGREDIAADGEAMVGANRVVDFLGLHPVFEQLNDQISLNPDGVYNDIKSHLAAYKEWEIFFEETTRDHWLTINWSAFGRVIGAAVANQGASEDHWKIQGKDALDSLRFWNDLDDRDPKVSRGDGLPMEKWNDIVEFWSDRNYDPDSEVARAIDHPPSAPFRRCYNRLGEDVVMPNPLALGFRKMLYGTFGMTFGEEEPQEIQKSYGRTILQKMLREQIGRASRSGNYAPLVLFIHSVCSHHLMRSNVAQQKIGLHLISMLGMRLQMRGVGALNVPDLAASLRSSFTMGPVMKILRDSKLAVWSFADIEVVRAEVKDLASQL